MPTTITALSQRVAKLESAIHRLAKQQIDPDTILTEEDYRALLSYRDQRARGTLINGEQVRRELRL